MYRKTVRATSIYKIKTWEKKGYTFVNIQFTTEYRLSQFLDLNKVNLINIELLNRLEIQAIPGKTTLCTHIFI